MCASFRGPCAVKNGVRPAILRFFRPFHFWMLAQVGGVVFAEGEFTSKPVNKARSSEKRVVEGENSVVVARHLLL